jgi:hypothetical protein
MSDGGGTTPAHPNMLRNILTGVITTVLGATAVYFLGFHNNNNETSHGSYLEVKEATTKAWKSYVAIENLEYKNTMLLANHLKDLNSLDEFKDELKKESDKFSTDIEALQKTKDVDDGFISLLKRRLDAEKEAMDKWNSFFASCSAIINSTQPGQERNNRVVAEYNKMQTNANFIVERAKNEITDLSKSLTEKYGQPFAVTDLLMFQTDKNNQNNTNNNINNNNTVNTNNSNPSENNNNNNYNATNNANNTNYNNTNTSSQITAKTFVGEWDGPGGQIITLSSNGRMSWEASNGQSTSGTWQFYNNQLYMTYPNQYGVTGTYAFNLSNLAANSFTMTLSTSPYYRYDLTRFNDNY